MSYCVLYIFLLPFPSRVEVRWDSQQTPLCRMEKEGGVAMKKHIVRYYHSPQRNNVKPLSLCLNADYDIYPCCYD